MKLPFDRAFLHGRVGENAISFYLQARFGALIVPVYEKEKGDFMGPRCFGPGGVKLTLPDMFAISTKGATWVEVKTKDHFIWHRMSGTWQTGIDVRHYEHYLRFADLSPWPIWLMFLHLDDTPERNCPEMPEHCPVGLFGEDITVLREKEHHRDKQKYTDGSEGGEMVYWVYDERRKHHKHALSKIADLESFGRYVREGQRDATTERVAGV